MKNMNKKGFTLAELLIVVAIIAVLTVVAVPIFTTQLEKSREETDIANMREAKAAAAAAYLADEEVKNAAGTSGTKVGPSQSATSSAVYWDAAKGQLVADKPTTTYGKGTKAKGGCEAMFGYDQDTVAAGKILEVDITSANGEITMIWVNK